MIDSKGEFMPKESKKSGQASTDGKGTKKTMQAGKHRMMKPTPMPTGGVDVMLRDDEDKVFIMSWADLQRFRRPDLETETNIAAIFSGREALIGMKNAWKVATYQIRDAS
jgi:hypothetical protein